MFWRLLLEIPIRDPYLLTIDLFDLSAMDTVLIKLCALLRILLVG